MFSILVPQQEGFLMKHFHVLIIFALAFVAFGQSVNAAVVEVSLTGELSVSDPDISNLIGGSVPYEVTAVIDDAAAEHFYVEPFSVYRASFYPIQTLKIEIGGNEIVIQDYNGTSF